MKLWILNHYALKPTDSGGTRHYDLSLPLVKKGHKVRIFASSFLHYNYSWRKGKRKNFSEDINGIIFEWLWTSPYFGNGVKRFLNMVSYFFVVIFRGLRIKEKPDVIVGSSVHLFACLAAYILSKFKKATFIIEIRDLWPKTLIDIGAISKNNIIVLIFSCIEKFVYKRARKIIVLLPEAQKYISSLGINPRKIQYIPNGISIKKLDLLDEQSSLKRKLELIKKKHAIIAMYMGAHGKANALDTIIKSAANFNSKEIAIVFVGDGPEKYRLQSEAAQYEHVYFFDSIPKSEVYSTLNMADILLISMLDLPLYKFGFSFNKLFDYLLIGKPILLAGDVANNIVELAGAGITIKPEDPKEFSIGLKKMIRLNEDEKREISLKSRKYINDFHEIDHLSQTFIKTLLSK